MSRYRRYDANCLCVLETRAGTLPPPRPHEVTVNPDFIAVTIARCGGVSDARSYKSNPLTSLENAFIPTVIAVIIARSA